MICPNCKSEMADGTKFCMQCGSAMESAPSQQSQEEVRPRSTSAKRNIIILVIVLLLAVVGAVVAVIAIGSADEDADVAGLLTSAERYIDEQEYEKAIIEFEKILEIDPMNVDAYIGIAEAYIALGDTEAAEEWLKKGIELTGDSGLEEMLAELEAGQGSTPEQTSEAASATTTTAAVTTATATTVATEETQPPQDIVTTEVEEQTTSATADNTTAQAPEEMEETEDIPVTDASLFEYEYDAARGGMVITDYLGDVAEISIPDTIDGEPVVAIENFAFFYYCTMLTNVIIPDGVTEIGQSAFSCCTSLERVYIPESVTVIGNGAFSDCTGPLTLGMGIHGR